MSENLSFRAPVSEKAEFVDTLHDRAGGLSQDNKSLGELHPIVVKYVETDTSSQDFGRIKDARLAEDMAYERNKHFDENEPREAALYASGAMTDEDRKSAREFDDEQVDNLVDASIYNAVAQKTNPEEAKKAVQDYRITQGDRSAMSERSVDVSQDMYHRMVNPFAAAADIGRSIKAARQARRERKAKTEQ